MSGGMKNIGFVIFKSLVFFVLFVQSFQNTFVYIGRSSSSFSVGLALDHLIMCKCVTFVSFCSDA